MLKILWKRGEIAPQEQFLLFSTIFCNLILDFCVITRTRFFLRDKRLFEITEVEITRADCMCLFILDTQDQVITFGIIVLTLQGRPLPYLFNYKTRFSPLKTTERILIPIQLFGLVDEEAG